ncbi:MAG: protein kinase [Planctomycetaceae bacterium]|nr:protein kinase [Planctomycetaceae bacterium]
MTVAVSELLNAIDRSGVVDREALAIALETFPSGDDADSESLAKHLISHQVLTRYQARELLQGRFRRLQMEHFVIRDILGVGGMGTVFRAYDSRRDEEVALKVLSERFKHDAGMRARFRLEARAGLRLQHPHIVKTYELGVTDDVFGQVDYTTMEPFPGIALHELVGIIGKLPVGIACDIISQTAEALGFVHQQGLVHRDVKPDNVLIDNSGMVKVIDFGLALLNEAAREEEFSLAMIFGHDCLGTPDYIPPEQAVDSFSADARSDVYGLGCTFFVALTGKRPFTGASPKQIIDAHKTAPVPNAQDLVKELPDELADIVQRMMAKAPDERFASMSEVQQVLAPFASRQPIRFDFEKLTRIRMQSAIRTGRLSMRRMSTVARLSSAARLSSSTTRGTDPDRSTQAPTISPATPPGKGHPSSTSARESVSASSEAEQLLSSLAVSDSQAARTGAAVRLPDGSLFQLSKASLVIGRGQEADLTLDRMRLSSRHCRLFFDGTLWQIVDLDSKNGVKVNGERIVDSELYHGDRITLADDATLQLVWSRGPRRRPNWLKWGLIGLGVIVLAFAVIWVVNSL